MTDDERKGDEPQPVAQPGSGVSSEEPAEGGAGTPAPTEDSPGE